MGKTNIRIPGPTPYYPGVKAALKKELCYHRTEKFHTLHKSVITKLKPFFGTDHIVIFTSSGTGGMEAGAKDLFNQGDKVLFFINGAFGDKWSKMAKTFGLNVIETSFPLGKQVDLKKVKEVMSEHKDARGVFITHNETSVGVLNPVEKFAKLSKKILPNALVLVDSISVLGAVSLNMNKVGVDFVTTSSQKSWGAPPGLCMVGLSEAALKKMKEITASSFYLNLNLAYENSLKNETSSTPAVGTIYGLEASLISIHNEGIDHVYQRHFQLRDMLRVGIKKLGLSLLVDDDSIASPTVTAVMVPDGVDADLWKKNLETKFNTLISGTKGELKGKVVRIAHMGYVTKEDIELTLDVIKKSLEDMKNKEVITQL